MTILVVVKNPADFIGSHLGQSEANTKGILATTLGKVLVIDEAYMLSSQNGEKANGGDTYKTAVSIFIVHLRLPIFLHGYQLAPLIG